MHTPGFSKTVARAELPPKQGWPWFNVDSAFHYMVPNIDHRNWPRTEIFWPPRNSCGRNTPHLIVVSE